MIESEIILPIVILVFMYIGYLVSKSRQFNHSRNFRLLTYFIITLIGLLASFLVYLTLGFIENLGNISGILAGSSAMAYYVGTRITNKTNKKNKGYILKIIYGILMIISGVNLLINIDKFGGYTDDIIYHTIVIGGASQIIFGVVIMIKSNEYLNDETMEASV